MALEEEQQRTDALIQFAIQQHNRGIQEDKEWRLKSQQEMREMIKEQRRAHWAWQEEQARLANEGGMMAGLFTGMGTGASVGGAIGGGYGALLGGAIGAVGGAIYGGTQGRQAVAEVAPYAGTVTNLAAMSGQGIWDPDYKPGATTTPAKKELPPFWGTAPQGTTASFGPPADYGANLGQGPLSLETQFQSPQTASIGLAATPSVGGPTFDIDYSTPYAASVQGGAVGDVDNAQNQYMSNAMAARGYNINLPQGYTGLPPAYLRAPPKRR